MSAATDEAEDGPLDLNSEGNGNHEKTWKDDEDERTQEEELPTPKRSKPNGFEEDDSLAPNNDVESEDFGPLQSSSGVPERPSSADGSLSIPDDSPSLPVRPMRLQGRPYSDYPRGLSNRHLQVEGFVYPIIAGVQHHLYGLLTSVFKLACPLPH